MTAPLLSANATVPEFNHAAGTADEPHPPPGPRTWAPFANVTVPRFVTVTEHDNDTVPDNVTVAPLPNVTAGPAREPPVHATFASKSAPFVVLTPLASVSGLNETSFFRVCAGTEILCVPRVLPGRQTKSVPVGGASVDQLPPSVQFEVPAAPVHRSVAPATGHQTVGVTLFDAVEVGPVPTALVAVTLNVYGVPPISPLTVTVVAPLVLAVMPPGEEVTV
jgi:hypothetical protein